MLLIALTRLVSWPLIAWDGLIGIEARGFILPMGAASAFAPGGVKLWMAFGGDVVRRRIVPHHNQLRGHVGDDQVFGKLAPS
ncbi:MAG: hypothetical protein WD969_12915 [Paracoccaceae bacterium]